MSRALLSPFSIWGNWGLPKPKRSMASTESQTCLQSLSPLSLRKDLGPPMTSSTWGCLDEPQPKVLQASPGWSRGRGLEDPRISQWRQAWTFQYSAPAWVCFHLGWGKQKPGIGYLFTAKILRLSPGSITCLLVTLGKFLTVPCLSFLFYKMRNIIVPTFESILWVILCNGLRRVPTWSKSDRCYLSIIISHHGRPTPSQVSSRTMVVIGCANGPTYIPF